MRKGSVSGGAVDINKALRCPANDVEPEGRAANVGEHVGETGDGVEFEA